MKVTTIILTTLIAVGLLTGCAKYKPKECNNLQSRPHREKGLTVYSAVLNQKECKRLFNNRSSRMKGYVPIQLTISNNLPYCYKLEGSSITLDLIPAHQIARKISFNTAGRVLGWGIAGLIFPIFFIPAIVDGIDSTKANKAIKDDLSSRTIDDDSVIYIKPYSIKNRVMFVETKSYQSTFELDLINVETGDINQFRIELEQD